MTDTLPIQAEIRNDDTARTSARRQSKPAPCAKGDWRFPLSSSDWLQRLELLAALQVPCMMYYISATGQMRIASGVIQLIGAGNAGFRLTNDRDAVDLCCGHSDRIWLIDTGPNTPEGTTIEIYNRALNLVARLLSLPGKHTQAIWQDILGNPLLAIA